jgi:hypothetical protein
VDSFTGERQHGSSEESKEETGVATMTNPKDYKQLALALLEHFDKVTKEHRAMREVLKHYPALEKDFLGYMPHATQTVDSVFVPLRTAMESGIGVKPALAALLKLH